MSSNRISRSAFTLIELLVVISIISLLLSILLPSMVGARRTAQRVACMANLKEIAKGVTEYGTDNDDAVIGSPTASGIYLTGSTPLVGGTAYGPAVQPWDFMGPLAEMWNMGIAMPSGGDLNGLKKRFNELRGSKAFLCPANKFLAPSFGGVDAGVGWMVSYNTCRYQLYTGDEIPGGHEEKPPVNWKPSISRMGDTSRKIYCGDGSRYANNTTAPDYDLTLVRSAPYGFGGAFADTGAYSTFTQSWFRARAYAPTTSGVDARVYAYRHSTSEPLPGAKADAFKGNFAFYDGHVESLGDLQSSNPYLWLPKGFTLTSSSTALWPDTAAAFGLSGDIPINN